MFIISKRNIIIPGGKGREDVTLAKGFVGEAPDWIGETAYFKALVQDGKIALSEAAKAKAGKSEAAKAKAGKRTEKPAKPATSVEPVKEETPPAGAPEVPVGPEAEP